MAPNDYHDAGHDDDHERISVLFPQALKSAGDVFPTLSTDLVHRGMARGRHLKRVKTAQLTAATLSLALVTAGAVAFGTHAVGSSADGTGTSVPAAAAPTVGATDSDSMARWATTTLERLLPGAGTISSKTGNGFTSYTGEPLADAQLQSGTVPAGRFTLSFRYASGHTSSMISLTTSQIRPAYVPAVLACPPSGFAPLDTCTVQHVANGGTVVVRHTFNQSTGVPPSQWPLLDNWTGTLVLPNGFDLDIDEYDSVSPLTGTGTPTPASPVVSADQLAAILANPVWQQAEIGVSPPASIPTESITAFLQQMEAWKTSTSGSSGGDSGMWNDGVYYDGTVTTAVQEFETPATTPAAQADLKCPYLENKAGVTNCSSTTMLDGTVIVTTLGPLAPGSTLTAPTVYVLHRDGSEEAAREYNASAAAGQGDASASPTLTTQQLQTLALQFRDPAIQ